MKPSRENEIPKRQIPKHPSTQIPKKCSGLSPLWVFGYLGGSVIFFTMSHFPTHPDLRFLTRRQFFSRCALGLGSIALASLLKEQALFGASAGASLNPMAPKMPHFPAKAK